MTAPTPYDRPMPDDRPEPADRADGTLDEPWDGDVGWERDALRHDDGRDLSEGWRV